MAQRIGILGGTFDPIHYGHLILAELTREALRLDHIRFIVANVSPFKTDKRIASNKDRTEMVRLAIGGNPHFEIDTQEIDRGGVSYTIDTVRSIKAQFPDAELYLLMGADVLVDIAKWREPAELFRMATPSVISRGGIGAPDWDKLTPFIEEDQLLRIRNSQVIAPQIEISSTDLRNRRQQGLGIKYQLPAAVEIYILENELYQTA